MRGLGLDAEDKRVIVEARRAVKEENQIISEETRLILDIQRDSAELKRAFTRGSQRGWSVITIFRFHRGRSSCSMIMEKLNLESIFSYSDARPIIST